MSSNDRNQKRTDATEDDDFGDFEGPEDDAPECVQAMGGPPNWVFPDLLRVQSNRSAPEETESLLNNSSSSVPSSQSRQNVLTRVNDIRGATGRETGAIPKQRALDPPDVSLLTNTSQAKPPPTLDLCSSALRSNSYSRDSSVGCVSQSGTSPLNRPSTLIPDMNSSHNNGSVDSNLLRINQLERDLKSIQTQKSLLQQQLLQKDTQIRELNSQSRQSVPNLIPIQSQDSAIESLIETIDKFRSSIETAVNKLEQRLTSLENKVSNTSVSNIDSMPSNTISTNDSHIMSPSLTTLLAQQRKELESERRQNLLLFSSVLKNAIESIENHLNIRPPNVDSNQD